MNASKEGLRNRLGWVGLPAGPLAGICAFLLSDGGMVPAPGLEAILLSAAGRATLGLLAWMAVWWLTEAIPVEATALLPLAVLPMVTVGETDSAAAAMHAAAAPYANPFIFLFMGGFMLALAMERWGLNQRMALRTLRLVGRNPRHIVAGFMAITAFLSMWVSNTATTVTMLPIALSVTRLFREKDDDTSAESRKRHRDFELCLLLGIAYAASIGGIGTLIGTAPNLLLAAFVENTYGREISFVTWMGIGLPLVLLFLPATWWLLTRVLHPVTGKPLAGEKNVLEQELRRLPPMNRGEAVTLTVFGLAALAWILRPVLTSLHVGGWRPLEGLTDAGIAVLAALALFVIPVDWRRRRFVLDWETARRLPWGILLLFGGGLSLAAAVKEHGVAAYLGVHARALGDLPGFLIVILITTGVIFLTELTSNTATTATLLPVLAGLAPHLGIEPMLILVSATVAASCAFMMPVATPPNAIVYGTGLVAMRDMCRAGFRLNIIGAALVPLLAYALALPLLTGR